VRLSRLSRVSPFIWAAAACALVVAAVLVLALGGGGSSQRSDRAAAPGPEALRPHPRAVEPDVGSPVVSEVPQEEFDTPVDLPHDPEARLAKPPTSGPGSTVSPGAPTDAEVKAELKEMLGSGGGRAYVTADGDAVAPAGAPLVVKQMIAAANAIARKPYLWGGGHGRLYDVGYDCSGSLSFAFIHAGLLTEPIANGWSTMGAPGPGRWISIYSNAGHVWMIVAGLRYDTSAIHIAGSRWTNLPRSTAGFTVRHLPGL
jgi:hypothetical protein